MRLCCAISKATVQPWSWEAPAASPFLASLLHSCLAPWVLSDDSWNYTCLGASSSQSSPRRKDWYATQNAVGFRYLSQNHIVSSWVKEVTIINLQEWNFFFCETQLEHDPSILKGSFHIKIWLNIELFLKWTVFVPLKCVWIYKYFTYATLPMPSAWIGIWKQTRGEFSFDILLSIFGLKTSTFHFLDVNLRMQCLWQSSQDICGLHTGLIHSFTHSAETYRKSTSCHSLLVSVGYTGVNKTDAVQIHWGWKTSIL
jgi:hypothetical protein